MRDSESGIVLFNVLVMTALMALIVMSMLSVEGASLKRNQAFSEASQALSISRAAEKSVVEALISDASLSAEADHLQEAWARIDQEQIAIEFGSFQLEVSDAQASINLQNLISARDDVSRSAELVSVERLLSKLGFSENEKERFVGAIRTTTEARTLRAIVDEAELQHRFTELARYFQVLPRKTLINANTASRLVLEAVLGNPAQARLIQSLREGDEYLTTAELSELGFEATTALSVNSEFFYVFTTIRVGQTTQAVQSSVFRPLAERGSPIAYVFRRDRVEPSQKIQ